MKASRCISGVNLPQGTRNSGNLLIHASPEWFLLLRELLQTSKTLTAEISSPENADPTLISVSAEAPLKP